MKIAAIVLTLLLSCFITEAQFSNSISLLGKTAYTAGVVCATKLFQERPEWAATNSIQEVENTAFKIFEDVSSGMSSEDALEKECPEPPPSMTNLVWMTNLMACIVTSNSCPEIYSAIRRDLATNWTGVQFQGRELGYVVTNHVAEIYYRGTTNFFTLKTDSSDMVVWRTDAMQNNLPQLNKFYDNYTFCTNQIMGL